MVQILREQMRDYQADVSGAIRTGQIAQNVGEWNQVIQGAGDIVKGVANIQDKNARFQQAQQEQAEQNIIKTEIGQKADIEAGEAIKSEVKSGKLDPTTSAGKSRIEEIIKEKYTPYYGMGSTEKFKTELATMQRKSADSGLRSALSQHEQKQKDKAEQSLDYINLYNSKMAEEAGKSGDFDTYMVFTENTTNPIVDYVVTHSANKDKDTAAANWRERQGTSYLIGMAQTNPVEAAGILGIQNKKELVDLLKEQNPKMSNKEANRLAAEALKANEELSVEKLEKIFGDKVLQKYADETDPTGVKGLREELNGALSRIVRKGIAKQNLEVKQRNYSDVAETYKSVLSPNPVVSADASLSLANDYDSISKDFKLEVPNIKEKIKTYQDNMVDVKLELNPTMEGTINSLEKLSDFALDNSGTEAQQVERAVETLNKVHEEPVTQEQFEQVNNTVYNALSDEENKKQLQNTMAMVKANILDHYDELFPSVDEQMELEKKTDKRFIDMSSQMGSGIEREPIVFPEPLNTKKKVRSFNYEKASKKNQAKYDIVRNTYVGVAQDISNGNFEEANKKIFGLPYDIAKINYGNAISPEVIEQFKQIDMDGKQSVFPQFQYNGYSFQYMGIDKTGTILAKRVL